MNPSLFKKYFLILIILTNFVNGQKIKLKKYEVATLPKELNETSALAFYKDQLYTINDSGNPSTLFQINKKTGDIVKTYNLPFANVDWEALAFANNQLFIGDFGNNNGTRENLKIWTLPFIENEPNLHQITELPFYYPEQKGEFTKNKKTNFDAESFFYLDGKLHIFTKEWGNITTTHYTIDPKISTKQAAKKIESYPTGFLVTDVFYHDKKLYCVGYTKKTKVYLMIFEKSENGLFFDKTPKKYFLGSALKVGQVEGIAADQEGISISAEKLNMMGKKTPPLLYFIPYDAF